MKVVIVPRQKGKTAAAKKWLMQNRFNHLIVINNSERRRLIQEMVNESYATLGADENVKEYQELLKEDLGRRIVAVEHASSNIRGDKVIIGFDNLDMIVRGLTGLHFPMEFLTWSNDTELEVNPVDEGEGE